MRVASVLLVFLVDLTLVQGQTCDLDMVNSCVTGIMNVFSEQDVSALDPTTCLEMVEKSELCLVDCSPEQLSSIQATETVTEMRTSCDRLGAPAPPTGDEWEVCSAHVCPEGEYCRLDDQNKPVCAPVKQSCPDIGCLMVCSDGFVSDENGCDTCKCQVKTGATCPEMICINQCPDGYEYDDNQCQLCSCKSTVAEPNEPCAEPMCEGPPCIFGLKTNEQGCLTCECADPVEQALCPALECMNEPCQYGLVKDANGCDTCDCLPEKCPAVSCDMVCIEGYRKDENGCDICDCAEAATGCQEVMCMMFCESGFKKDDKGCDICECNEPAPDCPEVMCAMFCEGGFKKDDKGCDICECNEPAPDCPWGMCAMFCEGGFKKDDKGCDICECNEPASDCPEVMCAMFCETGFKKDDKGCDICECNEPVTICPALECMSEPCQYGLVKDVNGCDTCDCLPGTHCPEVMCEMFCEYGFKKDAMGCDICECFDPFYTPSTPIAPIERTTDRKPVVSKTTYMVPPTRTTLPPKPSTTRPGDVCQPVTCRMACPYGWARDNSGCEICLCAEPTETTRRPGTTVINSRTTNGPTHAPICPPLTCRMNCPMGLKRDERGCDMCECAALPETTTMRTTPSRACPMVTCPRACATGFKYDVMGCQTCECISTSICPIYDCMMICPYGRVIDEKGCRTCECKLDMCQEIKCGEFEMCREVSGKPACVSEQCALPVDIGPCRAAISKWYFDVETNECKSFLYGGCQGNTNNYNTKEECEMQCRDSKPTAIPEDTCNLPVVIGRCEMVEGRWHYDKTTNRCTPFLYSGCDGNSNNFETEADCLSACWQPGSGESPVAVEISFILKHLLPLSEVHENMEKLQGLISENVLSWMEIEEDQLKTLKVLPSGTSLVVHYFVQEGSGSSPVIAAKKLSNQFHYGQPGVDYNSYKLMASTSSLRISHHYYPVASAPQKKDHMVPHIFIFIVCLALVISIISIIFAGAYYLRIKKSASDNVLVKQTSVKSISHISYGNDVKKLDSFA